MTSRVLILTLCLQLLSTDHFGQGFRSKFLIPGSLNSVSRDAIETPTGDFIVVGFSSDTIQNKQIGMLTVAGTNSVGQLQWVKKYGGLSFQYLNNFWQRDLIGPSDSTGFVLATTIKKPDNLQCACLIKMNYSGDTLWQKFYCNSPNETSAHDVNNGIDKSFFVTGNWQNGIISPLLIIKTDIFGNELWRKTIDKVNPNVQWGNAIVQDILSKKLVIVGYQINENGDNSNVLITDSLGTKLLQTKFNASNGSSFGSVIPLKDGCYLTGGQWSVEQKYPYRAYASLTKFNISGVKKWSRTFPEFFSYSNGTGDFHELSSGDIVINGKIDTANYYLQSQLIRTDSIGNIKWKRYFGERRPNYQVESNGSFRATKDGGFILTRQYVFDPAPTPFSIIKLDSLGCDTTPEVCAEQLITFLGEDAKPGNFKFFPNPASDKIVFVAREIPTNDAVLEITDVSGRELKRIEIRHQETVIEISDLTPGAYLARYVVAGTPTVSRKLVVTR